jgi:centromere protein S
MNESQDDDFAETADRSTLLRQNFAAAIAAVLDADSNDAEEAAARPAASASFAAQLTEVAWMWTTTALAPDLEAFARHGKRAKIGVEDVLLAARKNEATLELMEREAAKLRSVKRKVGEGG